MRDVNKRNQEIIAFVNASPPETYTTTDIRLKFNVTRDIVSGLKSRHGLKIRVQRPNEIEPLRIRSQKIEDDSYKPDTTNILIIGDLHEPFTHKKYLSFCKEQYKKYNCTHVIFIGDIIDNHFASFHETDPDGYGGNEELERAIDGLAKWNRAFPVADVVIGNHDRIIQRKATSGGVPSAWLKDFPEVLGTPNWTFEIEFIYNDVQYIHGENGTARAKAKKDLMSTVQGHLHQQAYNEFFVGNNYKIFGMQVGCGIDRKSYAMAYAKAGPKPALGVGLVLNNGQLPMNILMDL